MMKIVIDIDEDVFTRLFDNGTEDYAIVNDDLFAVAKSIRNGTPLPKGHGRLIDADELLDANIDTFSQQTELKIKFAPTIIEADKEEENENNS